VPTPTGPWSSTRVREILRNRAQEKNTPMRCETAVAILASEGLALVSVSRQQARELVRVFLFYSCLEIYLRVEFLLKTESGCLRDAEVA